MYFINFLNYFLSIAALVLTIPILVFAVECLAAILPLPAAAKSNLKNRPKTAILIPAHNEANQIELVVKTAKKQLQNSDRLIVIADHCQDDTAKIARNAGATVIERIDEIDRGKGYALDCGLRYLEKNEPPEIVVFLDADCLVAEGAIAKITCLASETQRPVQAQYLMEQAHAPTLKDRVSTFALQVKNRVRFLGLNRFGGHCLLTGSGMAFPWSAIQQVSLVGAINADDMKLTVDLTLENVVPTYCEDALVVGRLMKDEDAQSQRTRWEHGHLQMISVEVPKLIKAFVKNPRFSLLLLALDISIPPLSLLVTIWIGAIAIFSIATFFGISFLPTVILGIGGLILFTSVFAVWCKFGTQDLPLTNLIAIPFYVVGKLPIYFKFLVNPQTGWLSTERD
jgi:glycosyltransferase involved in cell wall biosynthesis